MDSDLFSRRRAERFANLLDEAEGGPRHRGRSRADEQLAPLVDLGRQLAAARPAAPLDADFRTGLRAMLVATAERDGVGDPAPAAPAGRRQATTRGGIVPAATARRVRARGAILIGVAGGAIALSGISAASENAVPGDALYGMKRSTERAQLALTGSDLSRGQLFLDFARNRLAEAGALRGDRIAYATVLDDMDADTRQGVRLLTTSAVERTDPAGLDAVNAFVAGQRSAVTGLLDGASRAEQDRTRRSLALLDAIGQRSDALRTQLACGAPQGTGSDTLGPTPTSCPGTR